MKRNGELGPFGDDDGDNGTVAATRAQRQRELFDPQTPSERVDATSAVFDPQWSNSQSYGFEISDSFWPVDSSLVIADDANWSSAIDLGCLDTPPEPGPCQSGSFGRELPVETSANASVFYGMVIWTCLSEFQCH
jgi:hypothetical protein